MNGNLVPQFDQNSSVMGSVDGSDSNNHSMAHTETTVSESDLLTPSKKSGSSSSPSSSSSGSSFDEDFFQLEDNENSKLKTGITSSHKLDEDIHLASKDVPIVSSPKSEGSDLGSPGPTSPPAVSAMSPDLRLESDLVKQSPPIQVMDRSDEPAPYRIPSSVFARSTTATPQEWSVASNESLFSIHVGNNSFSREQMILMGRSGELDLGKSGELVFPLNKSGELVFPLSKSGQLVFPLNKSGELIITDTKSGELINYQISVPPSSAVVAESDNQKSDLGEGLGVTEAAAETMKEVLRVAAEDRIKAKTPADRGHLSSSISHRSDGSATSIRSFAFPIRKKKKCKYCCCAWPFCYCFNGSRAFCYCSWPSCYCRNGSWAFCYCSNCSSICSCASSILTGDGGKSSSVKADPEQQLEQQSQKQNIGATPNAGGSRWFSCFKCCPFCS